MLKLIHDPRKGKMRVAGLISGSGKSLIKVIEQQIELESMGGSPYEVVCVLTDNPKSKAKEIGRRFGIPVFINDIRHFYESRGKKITDRKVREEFDMETVKALYEKRPDIIAYAGYVWATTKVLVEAFLGVNIHPADLSVEKEGRRIYAGANGVRDALAAGEKELRSTAHLVTEEIDGGPILFISEPVKVIDEPRMGLEEASRYYLKLLNEKTRILFPRTIKEISEGRFAQDETGLIYYEGRPIPKGYKL